MNKTIFKRWWFWLIVILVILYIIGDISGIGDKYELPTNWNTVTNESQTDSNVVHTPLSPEEYKDQVKINDGIMITAVHLGNNYNATLQETLSGLETATTTLADVYDLCNDITDHIDGFQERIKEVEDPSIEAYCDMVSSYLGNYSLIAKDLKKYIDTGKMEHYSSATEGIRLIPTYLSMIDEERTAYLEQAGFSDKEISEITAE